MEVHPPHEPVHSWRDALIHIGLMTIGLFIALMLEGLLEYVHHKHLVREARENIRQELEDNHKTAQFDIGEVDPNTRRVNQNITGLHQLENDRKSKPPLSYSIRFRSLDRTAWLSARDTGALSYMPYKEVQHYADIYEVQDHINESLLTIYRRETESLAVLITADDPSQIPKEDFELAFRENATAVVNLFNLKQQLQTLDNDYLRTLHEP